MATIDATKTKKKINPKLYARTYEGMEMDPERTVGDDATVFWRILKLVFDNRLRISLAIVGIFAAAFFQLLIPQYLGDAVDGALGLLSEGAVSADRAREALYFTAALLLGASVLRGGFTLMHNYCGETIGHIVAYKLRIAFYDKLQQLNFSFHDHVHTGELITRGMLDLEGVRSFMNTGLLRVVLLIILIGGGAYLLISKDPLLGLLSLSFVPFVAWKSASSRLKLRALWWALQDKMGVLGKIMDENLTGIRVVRAFGGEPYELKRYDVASEEAHSLASQRIKTRVASTTMMTFAYFVSMGLVVWAGGLRVLDGQMTVGTLTEFLTFMTILQAPVRQLGLVVNSFARALTCGARLFAVLDLQKQISDQTNALDLKLTDGRVCFDNVSFSYPGSGARRILKNVSFEIQRGETLGIVGPPGSGKSTIAQLLPRYYDVSEGKITIDGQKISEYTLESLRETVIVLSQDPFLFTASLENNIAYGDPWTDDEAISKAASLAQIDGFIRSLPAGFQTLVGERGVSLSGGQKQRTAIARTAMLRPAIIILDDSTAAIDAGTEQRIRQALKVNMKDSTTIIISHRLGALRHANEIIVLDEGKIVERGHHDALVRLNGRYANLFALQSREGEKTLKNPPEKNGGF